MVQTLSFVVPVLNEQHRVSALLEDLRARYPWAELIVVDGGSSDDTVPLAMSRCDQLLLSLPGRARQMNLGGQVAHGDYLFFLHADTRPSIAAQDLQDRLASRPGWGFCRVRLSGKRASLRLIERSMNLRSRLTRVATGDQMLFLQRELFEETGGFGEMPLMEDVEYCKRLRARAAPLILQEPVTTSSRRWEDRGIARTVLHMWWLRLAYVMGISPARLHRQYYGQ